MSACDWAAYARGTRHTERQFAVGYLSQDRHTIVPCTEPCHALLGFHAHLYGAGGAGLDRHLLCFPLALASVSLTRAEPLPSGYPRVAHSVLCHLARIDGVTRTLLDRSEGEVQT
eukprot:scaffold3159_cov393-Prasinococcus_capsulatus_cf.AAC.24